MPLLIVLAGAYVAYKTNAEQNRKKLQDGDAGSATAAAPPADYLLDPSINRSNKTCLRLLPIEVELCLFELPITTLSFFEGSYQTAAIHVQARMQAILAKNPWLGGWLIRDEDDNYEVKLLYDETGQDVCQGYFQLYEPYVIPVGRNSLMESYHDVGKKMAAMNATIPMNAQMIGKNNMPIWKVSIIPDVDAPTERFSLAFSMSHVVADAHSYYKIFAMLNQDASRGIEALQPMRNQSFQQDLANHAGKEEADFVYLRKVLERQPPPPEPRQWHQQWLNVTQQQQPQLPRNRKQRNPLASSRRNTDKVVFKMFYVNEDWLLHRKAGGGSSGAGRRSSVYDVVPTDEYASVTAPATSMSSTAAAAAAAAVADSPCNNTADTHTTGVVSANSIITSWFFNVTKPSLGLMAANMRNRLDGIGENDIGNYVHTILYTPVDYKTPALIQESLHHMRRCGSDPISTLPDLWETKHQQQQAPEKQHSDDKRRQVDPPGAKNEDFNDCTGDAGVDAGCSELLELLSCGDTASTITEQTTTPPTPATLTSSISINWARYCPEREIYLVPDQDDSDDDDGRDDADNKNNSAGTDAEKIPGTTDKGGKVMTQTLHIPIFTFQELEVFPDTLSCIAVFTASPRGQHSPERRPGAWLICKESLWLSEIQNCGIVEEMIAEMNL